MPYVLSDYKNIEADSFSNFVLVCIKFFVDKFKDEEIIGIIVDQGLISLKLFNQKILEQFDYFYYNQKKLMFVTDNSYEKLTFVYKNMSHEEHLKSYFDRLFEINWIDDYDIRYDVLDEVYTVNLKYTEPVFYKKIENTYKFKLEILYE